MSWHYPSYPGVGGGGAGGLPGLKVEWRPQQGLYARVMGQAEPRDRIYLRRVNVSGSSSRSGRRVRWVHPGNPPGVRGGNLPPHLPDNRAFGRCWPWFAGYGGSQGNTTGGTPATAIRSEWPAVNQDGNDVRLFSRADLRSLFSAVAQGQQAWVRGKRHGMNQRGFLINFVVARPYMRTEGPAAGFEWVQYGPPSPVFYVHIRRWLSPAKPEYVLVRAV